MVATGLLIVSNIKKFAKSLETVEKYVRSLYIHFNVPETNSLPPAPVWGRLISQLYTENSIKYRSCINMEILVTSLKGQKSLTREQLKPIDIIFSDGFCPELCETLRSDLNITKQAVYLNEKDNTNDIFDFQHTESSNKVYNTVVLGGTFDRIHLGHKIFLTQAVLRSRKRLVVGVTTSKLTTSKTLPELILPVNQRIEEVKSFLQQIDPSLQYDVVPIDDPFGPTQSDPDMDMIVVSAETLRGGHKCNEIRIKNNLRPLEIFCIDIVENPILEGPKESKVSSSNKRIDMLGTRINEPEPRPHLPREPHIIGLTGCIASGKSVMAERFQKMGALVFDCDKIAHEVYEPGKNCFNKIVKHFGEHIVNTDGRIDRSKLGPIVFKDKKQLEALNSIVWPELLLELKQRINAEYIKQKSKVVIIEAAILLKAGWETECHEVWSMIIPPKEAIRRLIERNHLSEAEASERVASQMTNEEIVAKSNVIFSSQWDTEFSLKQAEKAWEMIMSDLEKNVGSRTSML